MGIDSLPVVSGQAFLWNVTLFVRALRSAGVPTDPTGAMDLVRALTVVDIGDREQVRAAGMAVLVRRRDDMATYDEVFRRFWQGYELAISPGRTGSGHADGTTSAAVRGRVGTGGDPTADRAGSDAGSRRQSDTATGLPGSVDVGEPDGTADGQALAVSATDRPTWSGAEQLRRRPFERMSAEELRDAERLVDQLSPRLETRLARRRELHPHGRWPAPRHMLRRNLQNGGAPLAWVWRRRVRRPRAIVMLCDVSGSMERHSRLLIRFGQAMRRSPGVRTETFVFATRLTRVTRELSGRDPDVGLARVSAAVMDWSGGTRIGAALRSFNKLWARRVLPASGVVMIVSDGWDRGDPALVRAEMAKLQRSCHRLIWLNPLAGSAHYQPLAAGMAAAMPHIDDLVAVNDLDSLSDLGRLLSHMATDRALRPERRGRPRLHRPRTGPHVMVAPRALERGWT